LYRKENGEICSPFLFVLNLKGKEIVMRGLEIVMNIDTLEVYEVIDHDKEKQSEKIPLEDVKASSGAFQLDLFESMSCQNSS
jgi:hypothetical protein